MKRAFPALTIALPHLMAAATAEPKYVEFNYDIARSYAGDGVSFLPSDQNPLPAHLLMGLEARGSPKNSPPSSPKNSPPSSPTNGGVTTPAVIPCSVTTKEEVSGTVTVLIAISKCLSNSAVETIKTWAKNLQKDQMTFFQDGTASKIEFQVASVPGTCQALSQANEHGQALLAADAVDERLASFSEIGRVLDAMPSSSPTTTDVTPANAKDTVVKKEVPVAVVSFVDSDSSFQVVQQYELTEKISRTFNFKICESGVNCGGSFENCITLDTPVDLFMYSPFKITSTFNCANLQDGAPVVYVNSKNERQCACTCPTGTKLSSDKKKCETVAEDNCQCVWANAPGGGYKKEITSAVTKCEFSAISKNWGIPAPVAIDNYVAKGRTNKYDATVTSTHSGPHIDLITGRIGDPVYNIDKSTLTSFPNVLTNDMKSKMTLVTPATANGYLKTAYTWSDYQGDRGGKVDKFTYTAYGKYFLDVDAYDYNTTSADCKGCIAIVDKFRPEATTSCPKVQCDKSTSDCDKNEGILELTSDNLKTVEKQIKAYYDFQDLAKNDTCDASTMPKRCDDNKVEKMNFGDDKYCDTGANYRQDGADFYNAAKIKADLKDKVGKLSTSDLCKEQPVAYGQCNRCIHLSTSLREFWTDYTCGRNYDTEKCEGKSDQTCDLKQCLAVFGDTIAVAATEIKADVKKESKNVVAELLQDGYNTDTQVHVALQCTEFVDNAVTKPDEVCKYTAKVQDLVAIDTKANTNSIFSDDDMTKLVTWRYRIDNGDWKSWDTRADFDYKKAETKISIEAWTKCGIVRKFFFYVNLHLNNPIKVCDNFRGMWYQTTNKKLTAPDNFCMFPKSDFAEVTFDYHANIGLQYSPDKLNMNIARVVCRLTYDDCQGNAKIVDVDGTAREIVSRFAVLAQRKPTSPLTKFHVTCDFTYKRYGSQSALTQTCNQDFFITDCTGPEIDKPCPLNDKSCPADKCIGSTLPAPYEACGGNIVSIDAGNNAVFTSASAADSKCCEFCEDNYKTTCTALSALPSGVDDIRRCEPVAKKPYLALSAAESLSSEAQTSSSSTDMRRRATLLLSASAMVALVALVVVQRRRAAPAAAANKDVMEDAYYPLLN